MMCAVSHEIRTPLQSLLGALDLLVQCEPPLRHRSLHVVRWCGEALLQIMHHGAGASVRMIEAGRRAPLSGKSDDDDAGGDWSRHRGANELPTVAGRVSTHPAVGAANTPVAEAAPRASTLTYSPCALGALCLQLFSHITSAKRLSARFVVTAPRTHAAWLADFEALRMPSGLRTVAVGVGGGGDSDGAAEDKRDDAASLERCEREARAAEAVLLGGRTAVGDAAALRSVLMNLVNNALRYTAVGEIAVVMGLCTGAAGEDAPGGSGLGDSGSSNSGRVARSPDGPAALQQRLSARACARAAVDCCRCSASAASTRASDEGDGCTGVVRASCLSGQPGAAALMVAVLDTGVGFDVGEDRTVAALFAPFTQRGATAAVRAGGHGLGLSIAAELVRRLRMPRPSMCTARSIVCVRCPRARACHARERCALSQVRTLGGDLRVHSQKDRGSAFFFELPLVPATAAAPAGSTLSPPLPSARSRRTLDALGALPVAAVATERSASGEGAGSQAAASAPLPTSNDVRGGAPSLKVLLVEDNAFSRTVMASMVRHLGHLCSAVSDGREALAALARERFDLVLMDVWMPVGVRLHTR